MRTRQLPLIIFIGLSLLSFDALALRANDPNCENRDCGGGADAHCSVDANYWSRGGNDIAHFTLCNCYNIPHYGGWVCHYSADGDFGSGGASGAGAGGGTCGSILDAEDGIVGESIPVMGTGLDLVYMTDRTLGFRSPYQFKLIPAYAGLSNITQITVTITIGGRTISTVFPYSGSEVDYNFDWDGLDSNGALLTSQQNAHVKYDTVYSDGNIDTPQEFDILLGSSLTQSLGIGNWILSNQHFYDSIGKRIFYGYGKSRSVASTAIAGSTNVFVPSADGSEIYVFDSSGKHLFTKSVRTGANKYSFAYDSYGRLISVSDLSGNLTVFNRSSSGTLLSIQNPYGQVSSVGLDASNRLSSVSNPNSETYQMTYDASGLLLTFQPPLGQTSTFTYDSVGRFLTDSNSAGNSWTRANPYGNTIWLVSALGRTKSYSSSGRSPTADTVTLTTSDYHTVNTNFSDSGSYTSGNYLDETNYLTTDPRFGDTARYPYSGYRSLSGGPFQSWNRSRTSSISPSDPFTVTSESSSTTTNSQTTVESYDGSSRQAVTTSPAGRVSTVTYDTLERPTSLQAPGLTPVSLAYDSHGRVQMMNQGSRSTTYGYNSSGYLASVQNPLSQTTGYTYDLAGRVTQQTFPDLRAINFTYDANGNVTSVTPPGKSAHGFTFNLFDLASGYNPPVLSAATPTTYTYNNDKQLTQITLPDSQTVNFNYGSSTGLLDSITTPLGNYTFNYSNGLMTDGVSPDGYENVVSYAGPYLASDQVKIQSTGVSYGTGSVTRNSDFNLALETVTDTPGTAATINYSYDADTLLTGAGDLTITRDATTGLATGTTLGNLTDSYTYNSFGEVLTCTAQASGSTIYSYTLTRDALGRIATKSETVGAVTGAFVYTYDSAGRLTDVSKNGAAYSHYDYDSNSNRVSGNQAGVTLTASYDAQDRLSTYNTRSYGYNLNGDLTTRTDSATSATTAFNYDVFGRTQSVTLPTLAVSYSNDSLNRRVVRLTSGNIQTRYVYVGSRLVAELDASGVIAKRYVYGLSQSTPDYVVIGTDEFRLVKDLVGSVKLVVNSSTGVIAQQIDYDEFGQVLSDTNPGFQTFGFAGGLYDSNTKLVRFGARDYDASTGRWISKDPIGFTGGDTNLYSYVGQDAANSIDPSGMYQVCTTPLHGLFNEYGPLYHEYLCANGDCGGQTPTGGYFNSPGKNSNDSAPGSTGSTCREGPSDNKKCMDSCIQEAIGGPRPNYSIINVGGINCQKWSTQTITSCSAKCSGK